MGYYVQVLGLGRVPEDVAFTSRRLSDYRGRGRLGTGQGLRNYGYLVAPSHPLSFLAF